MKILDWLRDFFGNADTVTLTQKLTEQKCSLALEGFAVQMAINLIAGTVASCEFRTMERGKPIQGEEYYRWNVEPNANQNANQFLQELVSKLLYDNEALVIEVNGQFIVADGFTQNEYAAYPNTFSNVVKGTLTFDRVFPMNSVLYFRLADRNIRALLSNLLDGYAGLLELAVGKYKRAGGRKGILRFNKVDAGDEKRKEETDKLFNERFKTYFNNENAVLTLPRGFDYQEISGEGSRKSTSDVVDIASITKEAFERVAQAFKIPPALLRGDIADVEQATNNFLTFCIDPLCALLAAEINRKLYGKKAYLEGSQIRVDTSHITHVDLFAVAEKVDKLISSGCYCIDEIRAKAGDEPLNTWWSKIHWITKNYEKVEELAKEVRNSE